MTFFKVLLVSSVGLLFSCANKDDVDMSLIPFQTKSGYQYVNLEGKIVINPQFEEADMFRNGLALVKTTGDSAKWGYIDTDGKFAIAATYKSATDFSDGLAWVVTANTAPSAINAQGEIQFTLSSAEFVKNFYEGLAEFSIEDSAGVKWGFVDKKGGIKIVPQFAATQRFSEKFAGVKNSDGKWGYIDQDGKIVINYQFDDANDFIGGKAVVSTDGKYGLIDTDGKYEVNPQFSAMISDGKRGYLVGLNGKYGWCDKEGKITINPQFEDGFMFNGAKLAAVRSGDQFGYVDTEGKLQVNPQFNHAYPFYNGVALVRTGEQFGAIDENGKYVFNPQFGSLSPDYASAVLSTFRYAEHFAVKSDFFDMAAVVTKVQSLISSKSVFGLPYPSTHEAVLKQFGKVPGDVQYSGSLLLKDFTPVFKGLDIAYMLKGVPYGMDYRPATLPKTYVLVLRLTGKGASKVDDAVKGIQGAYSTYADSASAQSYASFQLNPAKDKILDGPGQSLFIEQVSDGVVITVFDRLKVNVDEMLNVSVGIWEKLAEAYYTETSSDNLAFDVIGFQPPADSSIFAYRSVTGGLRVQLKKAIEGCPAGAEWSVLFGESDGSITLERSILNPKCEALTPSFKN